MSNVELRCGAARTWANLYVIEKAPFQLPTYSIMSHSGSHLGFDHQESFHSADIHADTVFPTTFGYTDGYRFEDWDLALGTFIRNMFLDPQSPPVVDARHGQLYVRFFPTKHLNTPMGQYYPRTQPMGTDLRFPNGH